jgi:glycosyltransferase involved in cell wall biosynthesis
MPGGECRAMIEAEDIPVYDLAMKSGLPTVAQVRALRRLARKLEPDVVQGWMYHGNLAATLLGKFAPGKPPVLWNIRHSVADLGREKQSTRLVIRLGGLVSGKPERIIFNSGISLEQHAGLGFTRDKGVMIPNGFDMGRFRPSLEAGAGLRAELGLAPDSLLVGVAARRHAMKGHEDFLTAAARMRTAGRDCHFVLAGRGVTSDDSALRDLAAGVLAGFVHLVGQREDMPLFLAGLDLLCVPSLYGEGFPNVLGEAMACGVPCVATDVGESRIIVADTGRIVPPGDPASLCDAMGEVLALDLEDRSDLGRRCRGRIQEHYSLEKITEKYADLFLAVAN